MRNLNMNLKMLDDEHGKIQGYGSVFGNTDHHGDIIAPTAFDSAIAGDATKVKMLWMHNSSRPVGTWDSLTKDEFGLFSEGTFLLSVKDGQEAREHARAKTVDGLSIGFIPKVERYDNTLKANIIEEVKLLEISLVTFPANDLARTTLVKSASEIKSKEDLAQVKRTIEGYLREVGVSANFAKSIVSNGVKAEGFEKKDRDDQSAQLAELAKALETTTNQLKI